MTTWNDVFTEIKAASEWKGKFANVTTDRLALEAALEFARFSSGLFPAPSEIRPKSRGVEMMWELGPERNRVGAKMITFWPGGGMGCDYIMYG